MRWLFSLDNFDVVFGQFFQYWFINLSRSWSNNTARFNLSCTPPTSINPNYQAPSLPVKSNLTAIAAGRPTVLAIAVVWPIVPNVPKVTKEEVKTFSYSTFKPTTKKRGKTLSLLGNFTPKLWWRMTKSRSPGWYAKRNSNNLAKPSMGDWTPETGTCKQPSKSQSIKVAASLEAKLRWESITAWVNFLYSLFFSCQNLK